MYGPIMSYLAYDHDRIEYLLKTATVRLDEIDLEAYGKFRAALLRHIKMEERILFPAMASLNGKVNHADLERIRRDHGAIAALLVPPPTPRIISTLRSILYLHGIFEEKDGGVYRVCEDLAGSEVQNLAVRLMSAPAMPVAPHNDRPEVIAATRRALARAGYELKEG
jgi:hypothetical protein